MDTERQQGTVVAAGFPVLPVVGAEINPRFPLVLPHRIVVGMCSNLCFVWFSVGVIGIVGFGDQDERNEERDRE